MVIPAKTDFIDRTDIDDSDFILKLDNDNIKPKHYRDVLKNESIMVPAPIPYSGLNKRGFNVAGDFKGEAINTLLAELIDIENIGKDISIKVKFDDEETKWLPINRTILSTFIDTVQNFSDIYTLSNK
jgi:hypothetical protein